MRWSMRLHLLGAVVHTLRGSARLSARRAQVPGRDGEVSSPTTQLCGAPRVGSDPFLKDVRTRTDEHPSMAAYAQLSGPARLLLRAVAACLLVLIAALLVTPEGTALHRW